MSTIRAAIVGYGNLGKSVEKLIKSTPDMETYGIFSRRDQLDTDTPVYSVDEFAAKAEAKEFDVALLCTGSATDIPEQAVEYVKHAPTVDTYDNHRDVPRHKQAMDEAAREAGTVAIVSTGWDPGMFSLNRTMAQAILPTAEQHTFWGPGLSQGHSDALRRIDGVKKAVQYTLPDEAALDKARAQQAGDLTGKQAHVRSCYVVADESEHERIEHEIRTMPDYFEGYTVEVHFIDEATFDAEHTGMPHGGHVITAGDTGGYTETIEYILKLDRNPDFTASVQIAYARAAARLAEQGTTGAYTVLEVAPYLISPTPLDELIARDV
ncbi:diaminopimelate dehydrogenase [Corynebacterium yudongzhengii]|uniref:Meso-diaminopimelate D-dehydrogenase n=1 Tax=Corynebacterium yudongzhengii TaxID=2080740 RepID=A0A2U1T5P4_9CORY|nr:diaminopimelate dehydrogenase [Corynebacterium yudongzhengii]AWB82606.1 diaminopimelate dehydrogenase [Corynebacterium yudongzhengii]PWC01340.1 diaminopimelate dehydrogenase [Corynebacterium yudongzhengii]